MSAIYDNWERLVAAVLKKEELLILFNSDSVSSDSTAFSFPHLQTSSFHDDEPFSFSFSTPGSYDISGPRDVKIDSKQRQSYPLPLPPGAKKSSSTTQQRAENDVEIPGSPWKKGRSLGRGLLGDMYIGFNSENGGMCAMKEVPLSSDREMEPSARIIKENIVLLSRLRHPNIVRYYGSHMVADKFYIFYEYMSRGSIYMILEQYGRLGESAIRRYTQQILSGLAYLHSKSIAHGDIKGANILIDPNGRVKLTNFAIEKQIAEKLRTSWVMDSPYWMAPEVIMNPNVLNFAADIWSLGCTVLEMATSKPPLSQYDRVMAMSRIACHKEIPTIPDHLSAVCKDFLRHCLQWDPLHRATASQLLEHPYVKGLSPLVGKMLVSTPLCRPAVANAVKSQGSVYARNPRQLDSGKVVSSSLKASKFDICPSDIYTPRSVLVPTSPVGSSPLQPRPPGQLSRHIPPPPKCTASNSSTPIGATQFPCLNQSLMHQESFGEFPKQVSNSKSPSYWDPNIIRGMFRFS